MQSDEVGDRVLDVVELMTFAHEVGGKVSSSELGDAVPFIYVVGSVWTAIGVEGHETGLTCV